MNRLRLLIAFISLVVISLGGLATYYVIERISQASVPPEVSGSDPEADQPKLNVERVIGGLSHPWEVAILPDESLLITERGGDISRIENGRKTVLASPDDVTALGEGGLLGLAVDPEYSTNRLIYACFNSTLGQDVRVARFMVNEDETQLASRTDIVTDIPSSSTGRHSGCRIDFGPDGNLWIGTGDAADEDEPQNKRSLGGKILRVNRDGRAVAGNITDGDTRIFSYGHRNTQGLAFYNEVTDGSYGMSVEHGPDRDDEINPLTTGNFGWAPGQGYDESVAMTDRAKFPGAVESIWSSGNSTIAVSGADFLQGKAWKSWEGRLAVAVLKDQHIRLFQFDNSDVESEQRLFQSEYGRIRTVVVGLDGTLYFTTDNGSDDGVYRVTAS